MRRTSEGRAMPPSDECSSTLGSRAISAPLGWTSITTETSPISNCASNDCREPCVDRSDGFRVGCRTHVTGCRGSTKTSDRNFAISTDRAFNSWRAARPPFRGSRPAAWTLSATIKRRWSRGRAEGGPTRRLARACAELRSRHRGGVRHVPRIAQRSAVPSEALRTQRYAISTERASMPPPVEL